MYAACTVYVHYVNYGVKLIMLHVSIECRHSFNLSTHWSVVMVLSEPVATAVLLSE